MKKIISGVIGTIIMANTLVPISVNAKVIEPEIVKTENSSAPINDYYQYNIKDLANEDFSFLINPQEIIWDGDEEHYIKADRWKTYYYIGDKSEMLYPLECMALYTVWGDIDCYYWNTIYWENGEWKATFEEEYGQKWDNKYWDSYVFNDYEKYEKYPFLNEKITIVNTPEEIEYDENTVVLGNINSAFGTTTIPYIGENEQNAIVRKRAFLNNVPVGELGINYVHRTTFSVESYGTHNSPISLSTIEFLNHTLSLNNEYPYLFTPYVNGDNLLKEFVKVYEENLKLKSENEKLKSGINLGTFGDIDGNNIIDAKDATILLTYYAKTSVGYTGTLEEFISSLSN